MKSVQQLKSNFKYFAPPALLDLARYLKRVARREPVEWEYVGVDWATVTAQYDVKGWNVQAVLEAYKAAWPSFVASFKGVTPLGLTAQAEKINSQNLLYHNLLMSYAYALFYAVRAKPAFSMLDWGGSIGHYYVITQAILPDAQLDYHCKDLELLVEHGQTLWPQAHFYADETCLNQRYDFVLASGSLQYAENWIAVLEKLARVTTGYLFVTRLPVVLQVPSYIMLQRPYKHGYNTEYLGWCFNRQHFLAQAENLGLQLVREFIVAEQPFIKNAPEQASQRGYLFVR